VTAKARNMRATHNENRYTKSNASSTVVRFLRYRLLVMHNVNDYYEGENWSLKEEFTFHCNRLSSAWCES